MDDGIRGGQGRTDEEVRFAGCSMLWITAGLVAIAIVFWLTT